MAQQRIPVEARRRQLVDIALAIAERNGPGAVTARNVAAEANVSLGLVHYCFETIQDLSTQMAERTIDQLAQVALPALGEPEAEGDIRGLLELAIGALWKEVVQTPRRRLLTFELTTYALRTPGLEAIAHRQYDISDRVATELLRRAARLAGTTWSVDVGELARLVVMAVDGVTLRWLADHDEKKALASLSHVADLIAASAITADEAPPPAPTSTGS